MHIFCTKNDPKPNKLSKNAQKRIYTKKKIFAQKMHKTFIFLKSCIVKIN